MPHADLDLELCPGPDAGRPRLDGPVEVVRMEKPLPAVTENFGGGAPGKLLEASIAVVNCAVRRRPPEHLRDRLAQVLQVPFARADHFLRALQFLDVDRGAEPLDTPAPTGQRNGAIEEPTILAIGAPKAGLRLAGAPRGEQMFPDVRVRREVVGMHRLDQDQPSISSGRTPI